MSQVPAVSRWVNRLMTGKSYVDAVHVRGGCLYTKVWASCGGRPVKSANGPNTIACNACPGRKETLGHIVQQYPKSAFACIERHSNLEKFVTQKLSAKGFTCAVEPVINTVHGVRRPDIVMRWSLIRRWSVTCPVNWTELMRVKYPSTISPRFMLEYPSSRRFAHPKSISRRSRTIGAAL